MAISVSEKALEIIAKRQEQKRIIIENQKNTGEPVIIPTRDGSSRCLMYRPDGVKGTLPLFLDIHGGGFTNDFPEADDPFCRKVADTLGICVITIEYRLAPEFPYPCGLQDAYDVVKYVHDHAEQFQIDPEHMAIGGHSAGGNLAAAICQKAAQTEDFHLRCQILDYPPLDLAMPSSERYFPEGPLTPELSDIFNACYRLPEQAKEIGCSPLFAPDELLSKLPPAVILTAEKDCLREDGEQYALRLARNGVPVSLKRFVGAAHGFTIGSFLSPEAQEGHGMMIDGLKYYL